MFGRVQTCSVSRSEEFCYKISLSLRPSVLSWDDSFGCCTVLDVCVQYLLDVLHVHRCTHKTESSLRPLMCWDIISVD